MDPHFYNVKKMIGQKKKFGKAPEAYKEVDSEKEGQFERNEPSNNAQGGHVETIKSKGEPDPLDYSNDTGSIEKKSRR